MTVTLTQPVEGKQPGDTYTGTNEAYLLASGYADQAGYDADTAAVLVGGSNAVNIVTGGNLVLRVGHETYTVALADADTPAAAATKIDTALTGVADAAIVSSKLNVTSTAVGDSDAASISVVSGTGTVLANLGLTVGQSATGSTGGVGISNTGPADLPVASNPEFNATRGDIAHDGGTPEEGTNEGDLKLGPADAAYTSVQGSAFGDQETSAFDGFANDPAEFPTSLSGISRSDIPLAGVAGVKLYGTGLSDSTGVTVGGTAATAFTHQGDKQVTFTAPAKAAGTYDVVLQDPDGNKTLTGAVTYA